MIWVGCTRSVTCSISQVTIAASGEVLCGILVTRSLSRVSKTYAVCATCLEIHLPDESEPQAPLDAIEDAGSGDDVSGLRRACVVVRRRQVRGVGEEEADEQEDEVEELAENQGLLVPQGLVVNQRPESYGTYGKLTITFAVPEGYLIDGIIPGKQVGQAHTPGSCLFKTDFQGSKVEWVVAQSFKFSYDHCITTAGTKGSLYSWK